MQVDPCAAPGSKTTQIAERFPLTTVIANEPVSGRNTPCPTGGVSPLRTSSPQHDGRYFLERLPRGGCGHRASPCTGSATMRKPRSVWSWRPSSGRDLHRRKDIARRAAGLVRLGGHVVVSTRSLDPVENEAVIAEMLRQCPWMEAVPSPKGGSKA